MIKIKWRSIIICISFLLLPAGNSSAGQRITKAIYELPLESAVFKDKDPKQVAEYLKECGINAVVRVPLDNLLIDQLHKNGIKAYAEMAIFLGRNHWKDHPESRPVLADGSLAQMDGWYAGVCASQEWLINQKIKEAQRVAREYRIDGLWLDFIRWPTRWDSKEPGIQHACFCKICLEGFQKETGVKIPERLKSARKISEWIYKNYPEEWYGYRCDVIADTVKRIKGAIKKYRKDAIIGIFVVPWREQDFDNAIYKVIGQDLDKLSETVDVFSPMSYHSICSKDTDWIISVTRWIKSRTDKEVWPIVQSIDEPKKISPGEYEKALKAGLAGGSTGVMTFKTGATLEDGKWEIQKKIFTEENGL